MRPINLEDHLAEEETIAPLERGFSTALDRDETFSSQEKGLLPNIPLIKPARELGAQPAIAPSVATATAEVAEVLASESDHPTPASITGLNSG